MSSALAKAAPLKAEIRLAQAVSQFEADLSTEQKAAFGAYRSRSCRASPSIHDVMQLTAEIDRQTTRKLGGGGRCFGPRLTNILQSIQQFAALGDIIIGGSQNIIACGVWSLARFTLLSVVNFSSVLEKLSTLLMIAGRSAPRYERLALLYPRSHALQSHLSEYFIVIVRLCHQVFKFTKKTILGQLGSALVDSDIHTYQSELERWASSIGEEVDVLNVEEQRTRFKALMRSSKSEANRRRLDVHARVLDSCSTYDYQTTWKQIRKLGNATWFYQTSKYEDWKTRPDSGTLLCTGKLGSGKSVLLANIVDDLNLHVQAAEYPVAYFFCRHDISESLKACTIIGSLARQLLHPIADLSTIENILDDATLVLDFETILNLLRRALPPDFKAYFVLDGLDACDDLQRRELIRQVRKVQDAFALLLCVSFRLEADNVMRLSPEPFANHSIITISEDNPDIENFVSAELERRIESRNLMMGDPTLVIEIQDALLRGAQGMFLWVVLQIESLCAAKTDEAIRHALAELPKDLPETYSRILQRSAHLGKQYQTRILELVTVARRPLTTEELREALSVVLGDTEWNPARHLNDIYSALASCGSLITVDEEDWTVRLIHHSIKQFLLGGFKTSTGAIFTRENADRTMGGIIVTYLNYGIFETQISSTAVPQIKSEAAPSRIIQSMDVSSSARNLAIQLLKSRRQPKFDLGKALAQARKKVQSGSVNQFRFYPYAESNWQQHAWCILKQEPVLYALLVKLLERKTVDIHNRNDNGLTLLLSAAMDGHEAVVKLLAEKGAHLESRGNGRTALIWAAMRGHEAVVKLLAEKGADLENRYNYDRHSSGTALTWAAKNGHDAVVKLLAEKGAYLWSTDYYDNDSTALILAAKNGHEAVVKLLAEKGANLESRDKHGSTALILAAKSGHEAVVKLLAEKGANLESGDHYSSTALIWAAKSGHEAVVKLLAEKGANLEKTAGYSGGTALMLAAKNGHEAVVKLLAEKGANLESGDRYSGGRTALMLAAENGHEAVVKLLAEKGVNLETRDNSGGTALMLAAKNGHEAVVKLLAEKGANLESRDNGGTALTLAAENGHEAVVR
ncbi:ankyrin repeat-containing domain protein [Phialemonium atrogriseum]|uniref:Ankyrin repeat-containing domain protein n=1 Tax=Phialemonium atrogriseum TaxID=1093897 RepID=A0AAJ0FRY4_9PEZI|nr:ankyrin repeat-containing domain protein [Phialemonium atrogriseum]KAK1772738.1 ankyrin repeat-containing domain protein [Phialemonium atrogriseum]